MEVLTKHEKTDFGDVWHISSAAKGVFRFAIYRYDDDKDTVYLSNVFVGKAHRNQGLGNTILNAADNVAKKLKANTICLKVKQDTFVHEWYGRHGYSDLSIDEEEPQFIWMTKNIGKISNRNMENKTVRTLTIKDLRNFINQMEMEGLNDETVLTVETKRSTGDIKNITSMEYSPTTNILIFS